jgi:hypothetical protein
VDPVAGLELRPADRIPQRVARLVRSYRPTLEPARRFPRDFAAPIVKPGGIGSLDRRCCASDQVRAALVPVTYFIVRPGVVSPSFGSLDDIKQSLEAYGSPGLYDIIEGHSAPWLPGFTGPRWGIATNDPDGSVELIPDFRRPNTGLG